LGVEGHRVRRNRRPLRIQRRITCHSVGAEVPRTYSTSFLIPAFEVIACLRRRCRLTNRCSSAYASDDRNRTAFLRIEDYRVRRNRRPFRVQRCFSCHRVSTSILVPTFEGKAASCRRCRLTNRRSSTYPGQARNRTSSPRVEGHRVRWNRRPSTH